MSTEAYCPPGTVVEHRRQPVGVAGDAEHRRAPLGEQLRHAAPSPDDAPVTNATFPLSWVMARPSQRLTPSRDPWSLRRNRGQQRAGVLVLGCGEQLRGGPVLDRLAVPHHQHVVAHLLDHREVVAR